jgi:hypothetical protein
LRSKSKKDEDKSKYFLLKRMSNKVRPSGTIKGIVHSAEFGPKGIVLCLETGHYMELKVNLIT